MIPGCDQCVVIKVHPKSSRSAPVQDWLEYLGSLVESTDVQPEEQCIQCHSGYDLSSGRCHPRTAFIWHIVFVLLGLFMLFCVAWYVHLFFRPVENMDGLQHGLRYRSRTRLHIPSDRADSRELWPLTTNLCKEDIAGAGVALFFNYHRHIIVWSGAICVAWVAVAMFVSSDLLVIGTMEASTPQQLCSVIKWGHKYQHSTMWVKVVFILFAYLGTFVASCIHAGFQLRRFQVMDDETTMKDFAAYCSGIPKRFATDFAEEELASFLHNATGEKVVGASICWSYSDRSKQVQELNDRQITMAHARRTTFVGLGTHNDQEDSLATKVFKKVDRILGFDSPSKEHHEATSNAVANEASARTGTGKERSSRERSPGPLGKLWGHVQHPLSLTPPTASSAASEGSDESSGAADALRENPPASTVVYPKHRDEASLLRGIETSGHAIVVFETEQSRDSAVWKLQETDGVFFGENCILLERVDCEPDTVFWENCEWPSGKLQMIKRLLWGILCILVAQFLWATCFYLPYAYYTLSFSYARGEMPGLLASSVFTLLVVAGNQIMYFFCSYAAQQVRFWCQDTFEFTYMWLYTFACMVNLVFDLVVTFYTTYVTMVGLNVHTDDGRTLPELSLFELFTSYPMQRALGNQLFWYAFPSCFLLPYILEPIFAIYVPLHISKLIVRSNANFRGYSAEQALEFFCPMDLSRYADIMLNVCVAVTILYFPGGYVLQTFGFLCISHLYMYVYDHYRVLREIPGVNLGSDCVDRSVNILMALPCCILLTCLIFKLHCLPGWEEVSGWRILCQIVLACIVHTVLHLSILLFVIPRFGRRHHRSELSYAETAARLPCSWFNANPVHCLRSKYIYHHKPYFLPFVRGKEHLHNANPSIGQYFQGAVKY